MSNKKVVFGQSVIDICMWAYGSINSINQLMNDNPSFKFDEIPAVGSVINIEEGKEKSTFNKYEIIPSSGKY